MRVVLVLCMTQKSTEYFPPPLALTPAYLLHCFSIGKLPPRVTNTHVGTLLRNRRINSLLDIVEPGRSFFCLVGTAFVNFECRKGSLLAGTRLVMAGVFFVGGLIRTLYIESVYESIVDHKQLGQEVFDLGLYGLADPLWLENGYELFN